VLHAFVSGSTGRLSGWARGIRPVSRDATWFNFLASHDGIGLRATEGILDDTERRALVERTLTLGGRVSMALTAPGRETVYELNVSYLDALASPEEHADPEVVVRKALAAHSILLTVVGVPAVYYHSLFGSGSDEAGMATSGINRRINRAVLDADALVTGLREDPRRRGIFEGMGHMLRVRATQPALSPYGDQVVEELDDRVFAVRRSGTLLCLTNVTGSSVGLPTVSGVDVLTGRALTEVVLGPWEYVWLR
jgi:glucosylglycerate phosphorylase